MVVGYNEFADQWADAIETTMDAFERIGVERVFWLTLWAGHRPVREDERGAQGRGGEARQAEP